MRTTLDRLISWTGFVLAAVLLVAGGSGVAPLMSMIRHRAAAAPEVRAALLYSPRTAGDVIFGSELRQRATGPAMRVFAFFHASIRNGG